MGSWVRGEADGARYRRYYQLAAAPAGATVQPPPALDAVWVGLVALFHLYGGEWWLHGRVPAFSPHAPAAVGSGRARPHWHCRLSEGGGYSHSG